MDSRCSAFAFEILTAVNMVASLTAAAVGQLTQLAHRLVEKFDLYQLPVLSSLLVPCRTVVTSACVICRSATARSWLRMLGLQVLGLPTAAGTRGVWFLRPHYCCEALDCVSCFWALRFADRRRQSVFAWCKRLPGRQYFACPACRSSSFKVT